ncbi:MAG: hypothetical protein H6672_14870 [Anaerolineaceae bacterium]|nr:hypothetical protein [Anaerolineaceae bacterium]
MTTIQKTMVALVIIISLLFGLQVFSQDSPQLFDVLPPEQEAFLDDLAEKTFTYLQSATSHHLPFSWSGVAPYINDNGTYANPAEIGLYMLSYVGAYEMQAAWSPTKAQVEAELSATLTQLRQWQSDANSYQNSVFYRAYWVANNPPIAGPDDPNDPNDDINHEVPSIDNAILAASLMTIKEWADENTAPRVARVAQAILNDMDFMLWYDNGTHRFQLGDTDNPLGGGPADYYSNENRLINFVARSLGQMTTEEFQISLAALEQFPATYTPAGGDPITVGKVAWDGSYFTYLAPALFLRELESDYATNTIDPATLAQIAYADKEGYTAWGLSDVYTICAFDELYNAQTTLPSYALQGAPPLSPTNADPEESLPGLITPHASALALLIPAYANAAASNLQALSLFNQLYSSEYGFKDSVMVRTGDDYYGEASCRYTALAQAYILLSIAEHQTGFMWKYYYLNPQVQLAHQEADLSCSLGPSNPQGTGVDNLENNAADWGMYCDNSTPRWTRENVSVITPSRDNRALQCSFVEGGDSYGKLHCYNNLYSAPDATMFTADFAFQFTPTTCNNLNGTSIVQALEFTMSKWLNGKRYEFAMQWENVDDGSGGSPQWRYWDGVNAWQSLYPLVSQCLSGGNTWYTLRLEGVIANDQVEYRGFTVGNAAYPQNAVEHPLDITVAPVDDSQTDHLAIAIQMDANESAAPYDLRIDNVRFVRWDGLLTALSPPDDNLSTTTRPTFSWNAVPDAVRYELKLDTVYPPTRTVANSSAQSYTPSSALTAGQTYCWRVRAVNAAGNTSPWTPIRTVTIPSSTSAAPLRNYYTTDTPALSWNRVSEASGYEIEVSSTLACTPPFDYSTTVPADTLYITTPSLANGRYTWRVRAISSNGAKGAWSATESFMVDVP